jgi:hypothetical protein
MTTPLTTQTKHIFKVFKDSVYSTQILLRIDFAAVLIITAALWSAQENAEF